jgi:hypothetical protein
VRSSSHFGPELERLAFAAGIKPALRAIVSLARVPALERELADRGAYLASVDIADGNAVVYAARDRARAEALREAEAAILPHGARAVPSDSIAGAHREVGRLLGYPRCCVDAYLERVARGVKNAGDGTEAAEEVVAARAALARSERSLARLNFLLPKRRALVPFDPCRFDCDLASRYASALFDLFAREREDEAASLREALSREVRLDRYGRRVDPRDPKVPMLVLEFAEF